MTGRSQQRNISAVLGKSGELLTDLTTRRIDELFADGTISGGMLPNIAGVLDAAKSGATNAPSIRLNPPLPPQLAGSPPGPGVQKHDSQCAAFTGHRVILRPLKNLCEALGIGAIRYCERWLRVSVRYQEAAHGRLREASGFQIAVFAKTEVLAVLHRTTL